MSIPRRNCITIVVGALHLMLVAAAAYGVAIVNPLKPNIPNGTVLSAATYTVKDISYTLDAQYPELIEQVKFTISPASSITSSTTVEAKLLTVDTAYFPCTNISPAGGTWQCTFSGVTVAATDELDVHVLQLQHQGIYAIWLPLVRGPQASNTYLPMHGADQNK